MQEERRRETISRTVEVDFTYKKVVLPVGEFARVLLRLEPLPRGTGVQIVSDLPADSLPESMLAGALDGLREAVRTGVLDAGPVVDVRATLIGSAYHDIDSNHRTFSMAAQGAFRDAMHKAGPKLLLR